MGRKYIDLKDNAGNTLYPSAYMDDTGAVIKDTYLRRNGDDHYIYWAYVTSESSELPAGVKKLVLIDKADPTNPVEFYAADPMQFDVLYNKLEELEQRLAALEG